MVNAQMARMAIHAHARQGLREQFVKYVSFFINENEFILFFSNNAFKITFKSIAVRSEFIGMFK